MWRELIIYAIAPVIGVFMDKMYFRSIKNIIHGYFTPDTRYKWSDFIGMRLLGTIFSSFGIAYSAIEKDIYVGLLSAGLLILSHAIIYYQVFLRERKMKK
jgi:hypothetical protein|tara:strand:- start:828 stop:1127 length:300 start_codon:yes stop_codon:yes gene_type:complete